jgi:hypothetical protein
MLIDGLNISTSIYGIQVHYKKGEKTRRILLLFQPLRSKSIQKAKKLPLVKKAPSGKTLGLYL